VIDWRARRKHKSKTDRGEAELDALLGTGEEPLAKALERAAAE